MTAWSVGQRLTHWATGAPMRISDAKPETFEQNISLQFVP